MANEIPRQALEIVKHFEGFSPIVYKCPGDVETIGYGHALKPHEKFTEITKEEAEELLTQDMLIAAGAVMRLINRILNVNQVSALISFTFNLGSGSLQRSTLRQVVNRGEDEKVEKELLRWVYSGGKKLPGLIRRRQAEADLYSRK